MGIMETINLLVFTIAMFNLKKVQIYMDMDNETEEDIKRDLSNLKKLGFAYCVVVAIYLTVQCVSIFFGRDIIYQPGFSYYHLTI